MANGRTAAIAQKQGAGNEKIVRENGAAENLSSPEKRQAIYNHQRWKRSRRTNRANH